MTAFLCLLIIAGLPLYWVGMDLPDLAKVRMGR